MGSDGKPALITHHGDFAPGDGIQDLLARMPDGKLYVYRGDGYGSVDIEQRTELWLPSNAPAPSTFEAPTSRTAATGRRRTSRWSWAHPTPAVTASPTSGR